MENSIGNSLQWFQLIITVVGLISIFIQIGNKQGQQDEKNKNFAQTLQSQSQEILGMKNDISDIKEDVAYIKGKLL
ncbi:MAG: hypothetical protein ACFFDF_23145 [Candidatus Odinarchaeota archaeon]